MDGAPDTRSKRKLPVASSASPPDRPPKKLLRSKRDPSPQQPPSSPPASRSPTSTALPPADLAMHQQQQSNGMDVDPHPVPPSDADFDADDMRPVSRVPTAAESMEWQATIEKVVKNVVAIHFCQTCSFDTDTAISSEATGFVVDAEKGYILTNRVCLPLDMLHDLMACST
jgi:pro-apoptotic serine protease NMA111